MISVSEHGYAPMGRFFNRDKCRACYRTEAEHPTTRYMPARPLGDKRPAVCLSPFYCGYCTSGDHRCVNPGCPGFGS